MLTIGAIVLAAVVVCFGYGVVQGVRQVRRETADEDAKRQHVAKVHDQIRSMLADQKLHSLPGVVTTISDAVSDQLLESRIGGRPAWPLDTPHPAAEGKFPLCFLAQINLNDMPPIDGFPSSGLLQFFFASDDLYGLGFPSENSEGEVLFDNDIHVVLHENLENMEEWIMFETSEEVATLDIPFDYSDWWKAGYKLEFEPTRMIEPTKDDYRIYDQFWDIEQAIPNKETFWTYADKWAELSTVGADMVIGGHPFFSQMDPRYANESMRKFTVCLLSIDSKNGKLLWGDCGTGSFLMRPDDLANKRFDQVLSNYDCL